MNPPQTFARVVNRKRYDVSTATLIASDAYWDGRGYERHGRNTFLYRTPRGEYFTVTLTQWQDEQDRLSPVALDEAIGLYEGALSKHYLKYEEAFPGVKVTDA